MLRAFVAALAVVVLPVAAQTAPAATAQGQQEIISLLQRLAKAQEAATSSPEAAAEQQKLVRQISRLLDSQEQANKKGQRMLSGTGDGSDVMKGYPWCEDPKQRVKDPCDARDRTISHCQSEKHRNEPMCRKYLEDLAIKRGSARSTQ